MDFVKMQITRHIKHPTRLEEYDYAVLTDGTTEYFWVPYPRTRMEKGHLIPEAVAEYSRNDDNNIIFVSSRDCKINGRAQDGIAMKHLGPLWAPLVITKNCSFYDDETISSRKEMYFDKISNPNFARGLYERIVDQYQALLDKTDYYISDMSGNNIMMNSDFSDFTLIDLISVKKYSGPVSVDPFHVLSFRWKHGKKIKGDDVLVDFLNMKSRCGGKAIETVKDYPEVLPKEIFDSISQVPKRELILNA